MTQVSKASDHSSKAAAAVSAPTGDLAAHFLKKHAMRMSRPVGRAPMSRTHLPPTRHDHRMLLVLDMDETLLHASVQPPSSYDAKFTVAMGNQGIDVFVNFRPYLHEFLNACSRHFEVAVFTASISDYANQVLDYVDPERRHIHHRLYRDHCTEVDGTYVKDLSLLARPLNRITIVDNSPAAYSFHPENAIAIASWFDDKRDRELLKLLPTLDALAKLPCVYEHLSVHARSPKN